MNRIRKGTILVASLLLLVSCGGPQDGKTISNAVTQSETEYTTKHNSLPEARQPVVSVVETSNKTNSFPEWILIGLVLVEGVCVIFLTVKVKKINENVGHLESRSNRYGIAIKRIETDMIKVENELSGSKSKTPYNPPQPPSQNGPREKDPIAKMLTNETVDTIPLNQPQVTADSESVFLKHFKDGILEVVSKEQAFFQVTFEVGGKEGHFEFIGDVRKALANKNSILDDVCETPRFNRDATQIITEKWGKCVKQQDGRWLVTQKAILSFK